VVIGIAERDAISHGTIYCTLLFIGREGEILGRHRKVKPTHHERAIWGEGDAVGLVAHQRPYARISGLNCWEHNSVLPGYVLMAEGTQVHVAAWPGREPESAPPAPISIWPRQMLLSRAFASQGGCYVILAGGLCRVEDIPERYHELIRHPYTGDSAIIDPRGEIIAGPAQGEEILLATGTMEAVYAAKAGCDVGGHYSRPDLFQVLVNRNPLRRVGEGE
jgi:nitrilase